MKQIYELSDFKTVIESVGNSTVETIEIKDGKLLITQAYTEDKIKGIFEKIGMIIRKLEFVDGTIVLEIDPPTATIQKVH